MDSAETLRHRRSGLPLRTLRAEVIAGPDTGKKALAKSDTLTVGTAPGNDLVLNDETVSRYHVELERKDDRILVVDHGSTNGTASGPVFLERGTVLPGAVLTLGRTQVRVDDGNTVTVQLHDHDAFGRIRGASAVMRALMVKVDKAAQSDASVLILGETGTGKEVIARAIHEASARSDKPFETVDCAALLPALVASELFGHEKGAFTGADRQHIGAFERADGGTIFLDEIGELPAALQAALLGALERSRFRRVGGQKEIAVDVRVVAATHRDLRSEVNAGSFRQDLYFRLAVLLLRVPPLRERAQDIPLLVEHFVREAGYDQPLEELVPANAIKTLELHHWPGNVRELRNVVEATLAMGEVPEFQGRADPQTGGPTFSVPMAELLRRSYKDARGLILELFEGAYLERLMEKSGGNISRAARESQINRNHLANLLKRRGIK